MPETSEFWFRGNELLADRDDDEAGENEQEPTEIREAGPAQRDFSTCGVLAANVFHQCASLAKPRRPGQRQGARLAGRQETPYWRAINVRMAIVSTVNFVSAYGRLLGGSRAETRASRSSGGFSCRYRRKSIDSSDCAA
jgi:hypothetical protein